MRGVRQLQRPQGAGDRRVAQQGARAAQARRERQDADDRQHGGVWRHPLPRRLSSHGREQGLPRVRKRQRPDRRPAVRQGEESLRQGAPGDVRKERVQTDRARAVPVRGSQGPRDHDRGHREGQARLRAQQGHRGKSDDLIPARG